MTSDWKNSTRRLKVLQCCNIALIRVEDWLALDRQSRRPARGKGCGLTATLDGNASSAPPVA